jgi:hypothetical protein
MAFPFVALTFGVLLILFNFIIKDEFPLFRIPIFFLSLLMLFGLTAYYDTQVIWIVFMGVSGFFLVISLLYVNSERLAKDFGMRGFSRW